MAGEWYYAVQGQRVGPVDAEAVRRALASGQIHGGDAVWREGMGEWVPASSVPELMQAGGGPVGTTPLGYGVMNYAQPDVRYAGFWLRALAAIIDGIITGVAGGIVGAIIGAIAGAAGGGPGTNTWSGVEVLLNVSGILIAWLYGALMESSATQATLGKMALGLKVTDEAGARLSFGRATGRHFGKILSGIILGIGFIMAAFTEKKQGLHDMLAGTLVVKKK
jgi:uncharacterized RDD family membrane protein YckC